MRYKKRHLDEPGQGDEQKVVAVRGARLNLINAPENIEQRGHGETECGGVGQKIGRVKRQNRRAVPSESDKQPVQFALNEEAGDAPGRKDPETDNEVHEQAVNELMRAEDFVKQSHRIRNGRKLHACHTIRTPDFRNPGLKEVHAYGVIIHGHTGAVGLRTLVHALRRKADGFKMSEPEGQQNPQKPEPLYISCFLHRAGCFPAQYNAVGFLHFRLHDPGIRPECRFR